MQRDERHTQCRHYHYHTHADTNIHSSRIAPRDRTVYVSSSSSSSGLLGVANTMVYVPSTYCETVSVSSRC
jgi:hypothetical protein